MINPINPSTGLRISLSMNWGCYSPETPKHHCRCNHTRVLLCRIFCANNCANSTWTKTALRSEYNSHESEMFHEFHLDTETSRLLIANWFHQNILTIKHIKISHQPTDWWLLTNPFLWYSTEILWLWCNHSSVMQLRTITSAMPICSVDRVKAIQSSMQLTAASFRHQLHLK